jgi:anti-sigma-K factor RskA
MTCAQFKELVPAWSLGALDEVDQEACEAHLASLGPHEGCEVQLSTAEKTAQLLAASVIPVRPSSAVWDSIERQLAKEVHISTPVFRSRVAGLTALAAALALVFLLIGRRFGQEQALRAQQSVLEAQRSAQTHDRSLAQALQVQLGGQIEICRRDLEAAQGQLETQQRALALLGEPSTQVVALTPQADFSSGGSVIFNRGQHQALVVAKSLATEANRDYELWVIRGKDKIAAGLLKVSPNGAALARIDEGLLQGPVDLIAVTLEPAGGGPVPRGPLVLVGALKKG